MKRNASTSLGPMRSLNMSILLVGAGQGVFDAEVEIEAPVTGAVVERERDGEAGDDLKRGRHIDCGAHTGAQYDLARRQLDDRLGEEVELGKREPDDALPDRI